MCEYSNVSQSLSILQFWSYLLTIVYCKKKKNNFSDCFNFIRYGELNNVFKWGNINDYEFKIFNILSNQINATCSYFEISLYTGQKHYDR